MQLTVKYDDKVKSWCVVLPTTRQAREAAEAAYFNVQAIDGHGVVYSDRPDSKERADWIAKQIEAAACQLTVPITDQGG